MTLTIDGNNMTIEKVVRVARESESIKIHPDAVGRIEKSRDLLEDKIKKNEIMYGVNTGIGELSDVVLTPEQVEKYTNAPVGFAGILDLKVITNSDYEPCDS